MTDYRGTPGTPDLKSKAIAIGESLWSSIPVSLRETVVLRTFGFLKIPMLAYVCPKVVELSDQKAAVQIPLSRKTKNHLNSMYFGALSVGADCAGGLLASYWIRKRGKPVVLVFKDFKAEFLKRPTGDVLFSCSQGELIRDTVDLAIKTGERHNCPMEIVATVPSQGPEPVAKFILTLSLKLKNNK
jgi:acyl-coenzyme A thioesterase PaaI-like protein